MCVLQAHRHKGPVVRAAHPALNRIRRRERLEHFADRREAPLAAHDHSRIVFTDVAPGNQRELVGARAGRDLAGQPVAHAFDRVAGGGADEDKQVVEFVRSVQCDFLMLLDVLDLEAKPIV